MGSLILTRGKGEKIMIGADIVITVFDIGRNRVRIGIDAPQHIGVHREEVYNRINQEKGQ